MNALMAVALLVLVAVVVACLGIQARLLLTRQLKNPHDILALAKAGHKVARIYVRLYALAALALIILVIAVLLRGH